MSIKNGKPWHRNEKINMIAWYAHIHGPVLLTATEHTEVFIAANKRKNGHSSLAFFITLEISILQKVCGFGFIAPDFLIRFAYTLQPNGIWSNYLRY